MLLLPTILIDVDYDGYAGWSADVGGYVKFDVLTNLIIGSSTSKAGISWARGFLRFSLASLPSGVTVSQVRLKLYCSQAGGASHLLDIHAYDSNGQTDPQPDDAYTCATRCASGNLYVDDSTALRTTGEKWFTLGGTVCTDVQNAKSAVNRFSLGLHEEGDNDPYALLYALENGANYAQLEITYEVPAVVETITAKNFPMDYLPSPAKAEQLTSKVSGATIQQVSQDYPLTLIKKDKAQELISKFTTPAPTGWESFQDEII